MAYNILGSVIIPQLIGDTSTVQNVTLGRRVQASAPVYGVGEFIYLKGVAR